MSYPDTEYSALVITRDPFRTDPIECIRWGARGWTVRTPDAVTRCASRHDAIKMILAAHRRARGAGNDISVLAETRRMRAAIEREAQP